MQINSIRAYNLSSFKGMPKRKYPYELPNGAFEDQADAQMPRVRKELKAYEDNCSAVAALLNLQNAIKSAEPYLDDSIRGIKSVKSGVDKKIRSIEPSTEKLTNLLGCHAQSTYQQDKHDAIWLFNKISKSPGFDMRKGVCIMADAFKKLDRTFDNNEIRIAEATIKDYYDKQDGVVQVFIEEIYGDGKNINFKA